MTRFLSVPRSPGIEAIHSSTVFPVFSGRLRMIAYPDTSVVLSRLLRRPNALSDWGAWKYAFTSYLCRVEFLRTVDRLRLQGLLDDDAVVDVREQFERFWRSLSRIRVTENVLMRSSKPFPTVLTLGGGTYRGDR